MRIVPTELFRDGYETFRAGKLYEVSGERGNYFIRCGWARLAEGKEYRWYRRVRKSG